MPATWQINVTTGSSQLRCDMAEKSVENRNSKFHSLHCTHSHTHNSDGPLSQATGKADTNAVTITDAKHKLAMLIDIDTIGVCTV